MKLRHFSRVLVQVPVECIGDDFFSEGTTINLSMGGLTITSDQHPSPGMTVKMRIFLPDADEPVVVRQAVVAWSKGGQYGVKALSLGEVERRRLNQFILNQINKSAYRRAVSTPKSDG